MRYGGGATSANTNAAHTASHAPDPMPQPPPQRRDAEQNHQRQYRKHVSRQHRSAQDRQRHYVRRDDDAEHQLHRNRDARRYAAIALQSRGLRHGVQRRKIVSTNRFR